MTRHSTLLQSSICNLIRALSPSSNRHKNKNDFHICLLVGFSELRKILETARQSSSLQSSISNQIHGVIHINKKGDNFQKLKCHIFSTCSLVGPYFQELCFLAKSKASKTTQTKVMARCLYESPHLKDFSSGSTFQPQKIPTIRPYLAAGPRNQKLLQSKS